MGDTDALRKFCSRGGEDAHGNAGGGDDGGGDDASASTGGETGTAEEKGGNGDGTQQQRPASGNQGGRFSLEEKGDPLGVGTCATPLWWAADGGHLEAVQCLLEYGADPRAADSVYNSTPLHRVAAKGHCKVAKSLLCAGASLSAKTIPGAETPLSLACRNGHKEMAALLIASGAMVTMPAGAGGLSGSGGANVLSLLKDPNMLLSIVDPIRSEDAAFKYGLPTDKFPYCAGCPLDPSIPAREEDRPYFPLRSASTALLERALDYMRKNISCERVKEKVYPAELLSDDERIVVLARVAEAMAGYGVCERNALNESMIYLMYKSVCVALDDEAQGLLDSTVRHREKDDAIAGENTPWRSLVIAAYQAEVCSLRFHGLDLLRVDYDSLPPGFWDHVLEQVVINITFGHDEYRLREAIFLEHSPLQQRLMYSEFGSPESYFGLRPLPPTDAEFSEADRHIVALTPKGRAPLKDLFPPDHFYSSLTMRQLVFSVEGSIMPGCTCDICMRCIQMAFRHRQTGPISGGSGSVCSLAGGRRGPKDLPALEAESQRDKSADADGTKGKSPAHSGSSDSDNTQMNSRAEGCVTKILQRSLLGTHLLGDEDWAAVAAQEADISAFFSRLSLRQKRSAIAVHAADLERSLATSREWDVLVTAEREYCFSKPAVGKGSSTSAKGDLLEYNDYERTYYPSASLLEADDAVSLLLQALNPSCSQQATLWRDMSMLRFVDEAARSSLGARILELHFSRLFAAQLLRRYQEAAQEAAAQAALESLLRDEEAEAEKGRQQEQSKESKRNRKKRQKERQREKARLQKGISTPPADQHDAASVKAAEGEDKQGVDEDPSSDEADDDAVDYSGEGGAVSAFAILSEVAEDSENRRGKNAKEKKVQKIAATAGGKKSDSKKSDGHGPGAGKMRHTAAPGKLPEADTSSSGQSGPANSIEDEEAMIARAIAESLKTERERLSKFQAESAARAGDAQGSAPATDGSAEIAPKTSQKKKDRRRTAPPVTHSSGSLRPQVVGGGAPAEAAQAKHPRHVSSGAGNGNSALVGRPHNHDPVGQYPKGAHPSIPVRSHQQMKGVHSVAPGRYRQQDPVLMGTLTRQQKHMQCPNQNTAPWVPEARENGGILYEPHALKVDGLEQRNQVEMHSGGREGTGHPLSSSSQQFVPDHAFPSRPSPHDPFPPSQQRQQQYSRQINEVTQTAPLPPRRSDPLGVLGPPASGLIQQDYCSYRAPGDAYANAAQPARPHAPQQNRSPPGVGSTAGYMSFSSELANSLPSNISGTDFSMPGEVEDGYSAAMAGIAALQLDGDTFSASTGGDSLLGMLAPAAGQDDPGTAVRSAFSTFGNEPPSSSQANDRNLQGVYGSSAAAPGTWESGSNWNNGMHGTATSWSTWGAG